MNQNNRFDRLQEYRADIDGNVGLMYDPSEETLEVWEGCRRVHAPVPARRAQYLEAWAKGYVEGRGADEL